MPTFYDFLAEKFVISIIIRIFEASVLAKPLNNAQIVRGVFCYTRLSAGMANGTIMEVISSKSSLFAPIFDVARDTCGYSRDYQ